MLAIELDERLLSRTMEEHSAKLLLLAETVEQVDAFDACLLDGTLEGDVITL